MVLSFLRTTILFDATIYISLITLLVLLCLYFKKKDRNIKLFLFSALSYFVGEIVFDVFSERWKISLDFIFFLLFYYFIFKFLKEKNRNLLKNPLAHDASKWKTAVFLTFDFFIIAALSYLIYYCFDRVSLSAQITLRTIRYGMSTAFLYPVLDFLLLGYSIYLSKIFIVNRMANHIPILIGVILWTIGDFLYAFEETFAVRNYGIANFVQVLELLVLILVLFLLRRSDFDYTTLDLRESLSEYDNIAVMVNGVAFLYFVIYLFCAVKYSGASQLMRTVTGVGIFLLLLVVSRQNFLYFSTKRRLHILSKEAISDPLTDLFTRKFMLSVMKGLLKSSLHFKSSFSVLMIDIDHFKNFNDRWGHTCGDEVLKAIAQLMDDSIPSSKVICRYGGEEFLIALPGMDQNEGQVLAETIRRNIELYDFGKVVQSPVSVTVSIGGATADSVTKVETDLIQNADAALYRSKEERNKTSWFFPDRAVNE